MKKKHRDLIERIAAAKYRKETAEKAKNRAHKCMVSLIEELRTLKDFKSGVHELDGDLVEITVYPGSITIKLLKPLE